MLAAMSTVIILCNAVFNALLTIRAVWHIVIRINTISPDAQDAVCPRCGGMLRLFCKEAIEGHTDSVPINTSLFPNNMMLSLYRAYSVFDFFVSEKGFSDQTMSSSGRGDAVPIATNDTPEGRAQNRRVEIKVYNSINS